MVEALRQTEAVAVVAAPQAEELIAYAEARNGSVIVANCGKVALGAACTALGAAACCANTLVLDEWQTTGEGTAGGGCPPGPEGQDGSFSGWSTNVCRPPATGFGVGPSSFMPVFLPKGRQFNSCEGKTKLNQ